MAMALKSGLDMDESLSLSEKLTDYEPFHDFQCGTGFSNTFFRVVAWNGHDDDGSGWYGMYFSDGNYIVREGVTEAYRNSRNV